MNKIIRREYEAPEATTIDILSGLSEICVSAASVESFIEDDELEW